MIARLLPALLPALLSAMLLVVAAPAQLDATIVHNGSDDERLCTVRVFMSGGAGDGVGTGFARVEVENFDDLAQPISVELTSRRWANNDVRSRRSVVVEPSGRARFFLPLPVPPMHGRLLVRVGGVEYEESLDFATGRGTVGLLISDRSEAAPDCLTVLQALPSVHKRKPEMVANLPADLPVDWRLFTAYSAVVVDGRAAVGGELQEALRRFAFAGGKVIVAAPERLPAGALREVAGMQRGGSAGHGLGFVVAVPPLGGDTTIMRRQLAQLPAVGTGMWPASRSLFMEQDIAGLGRAPVIAFVLVILLFAIVVGPVNFLILRRRKQPLLTLVTVPLLGFGTTAVILLYGIFHDGFGIRGAVTSWSVLDQARHEVATIATRSLFAGLAPNDLTLTADAMLLSHRAGSRSEQWPDRWHWDGDEGRLDGGVLPSRTVTPLVTVQQGRARQRLTVGRIDDDTLEVLADGDGGMEVLGELLVHDLDGQYWRGAPNRLRRISGSDGRQAFAEFLRRSARVVTSDGTVTSDGGTVGEVDEMDLQGLLPRTMATPGSYVAQVRAAPWLDEHGIDVAYDYAAHYVFGRLHAQDFVR